jgi:hypothetical protein
MTPLAQPGTNLAQHRTRLGVSTLLLLALSLVGLFATSASADVDQYAPGAPGLVAVSPTTPHLASGLGVSPLLVPAPQIYDCSAAPSWLTLDNYPSGFAIGNCLAGWEFDRSVCGTTLCDWSGGYVNGDVQGCAWANTPYLTTVPGTPPSHCANPSLPIDTFAYWANCTPGLCTDGSSTTLAAYCWEFGNYRPWSSTPAFADPIRYFTGTRTVLWRYMTPDGLAVMVHDTGVGGPGYGNWVYVSSACISSYPGATDVHTDSNYL